MRQHRGFTLVEILVVVGILAVLLAIFFPAFRYARVAASRARCLSNIKQILLALKEYATVNPNKLPPGTNTSPPWGAIDPSNTAKRLNPYLGGEGYRSLECPADQGGLPGSEKNYFETAGYSYRYVGETGMSSDGISNTCGSVNWVEAQFGAMVQLDIEKVRGSLGYYDSGPEDEIDPNKRSRDITRQEIDEVAWPAIRSALSSMQGKAGFNVNSDNFRWWRNINAHDYDPPDPAPPAPQNPRFKWRDQYDASTGAPNPVSSRNSGRWNRPTPWSMSNYNYDYWTRATKKVVVLDRDAELGYNTPGTNGTKAGDSYPARGKGFWHEYPYVPDPKAPTDKAKYRVQVHAGFLSGHAAIIEMNKYTTIDRDANDYY